MNYPNAKVYTDGSNFIAIPQYHTPKRHKNNEIVNVKTANKKAATAQESKRKKFDELYKKCSSLKGNEKTEAITQALKEEYPQDKNIENYVKDNIYREKKNRIIRTIRLYRKAYLQEWTYFCTFTYDSKKCEEQQFRKSLSNCLKHLASRKGWKYIGVWERGAETQRLHFHALVYVPDGQMIGTLKEVKDYDLKSGKMQTTLQNTHFTERYGRNDFKEIEPMELPFTIRYLVKYIDKSGERIVYSRGLPTYFISDIMDEDILCLYGAGDRKLLLFEDFSCWDEGLYMGKVSKEVIAELRKSN